MSKATIQITLATYQALQRIKQTALRVACLEGDMAPLKAALVEHSETEDPSSPPQTIPDCNWCGLTCALEGEDYGFHSDVMGGYNSTPGNGSGALDDLDHYQFALCEFCLDHLFQQFRTPPMVFDHQGGTEGVFVSAEERVEKEDWRSQKEKFREEKKRRDKARSGR